jgi:hypothetical protein
MNSTIRLQSRVGTDGVLNVTVALTAADAGRDVVVTIQPAQPAESAQSMDWHEFVRQTYGSCSGLGLERHEQGMLEEREVLQ